MNPQANTRRDVTVLAAIIGSWFVSAVIAGTLGVFDQPGVPPVWVGMFLGVPIAGFLLAYASSDRVQRAVNGLPLWAITLAHVWRFVGVVFVLCAVFGALPPQFGFPEGLGDIVAASFAIPVALALRCERSRRLHMAYVAWNLFGLADLLSAISLGILYSVSSFGVLLTGTSTVLLTKFPLSLIPTFFVPLFILLHLLGLRRSREVLSDYTSTWLRDGEIKWAEVAPGVAMRYTQRGKGEPLVLVHSLRTQADYFQRLIPLLKGYTVYAVDLPGFGHSPVPQGVRFDERFFRQSLVQFVKQLNLHDVALVGESIGGTLALTASTELEGRVARVVALNPYDYGESFGGGIRRGTFGFIIGIFALLGRYTIELRPLLWLVLVSGLADRRKLPTHLLNEFHCVGKRSAYRHFEYLVFKNWRSWLQAPSLYGKVRVPVTLVYGEQDWSRSAEREDRRAKLPRAKYVVLPATGHFSALEQPEAVAQIIGQA